MTNDFQASVLQELERIAALPESEQIEATWLPAKVASRPVFFVLALFDGVNLAHGRTTRNGDLDGVLASLLEGVLVGGG